MHTYKSILIGKVRRRDCLLDQEFEYEALILWSVSGGRFASLCVPTDHPEAFGSNLSLFFKNLCFSYGEGNDSRFIFLTYTAEI